MDAGKTLPRLDAHVSLQQPRLGAPQIHEHQTVEGVAEVRIDVEAQHAATELQILPQEHRRTFAVGLETCDQRRERLQVGGLVGADLETAPSKRGQQG